MILPPRPAHALSGYYPPARSRGVTPIRPHVERRPLILPPAPTQPAEGPEVSR